MQFLIPNITQSSCNYNQTNKLIMWQFVASSLIIVYQVSFVEANVCESWYIQSRYRDICT